MSSCRDSFLLNIFSLDSSNFQMPRVKLIRCCKHTYIIFACIYEVNSDSKLDLNSDSYLYVSIIKVLFSFWKHISACYDSLVPLDKIIMSLILIMVKQLVLRSIAWRKCLTVPFYIGNLSGSQMSQSPSVGRNDN